MTDSKQIIIMDGHMAKASVVFKWCNEPILGDYLREKAPVSGEFLHAMFEHFVELASEDSFDNAMGMSFLAVGIKTAEDLDEIRFDIIADILNEVIEAESKE